MKLLAYEFTVCRVLQVQVSLGTRKAVIHISVIHEVFKDAKI